MQIKDKQRILFEIPKEDIKQSALSYNDLSLVERENRIRGVGVVFARKNGLIYLYLDKQRSIKQIIDGDDVLLVIPQFKNLLDNEKICEYNNIVVYLKQGQKYTWPESDCSVYNNEEEINRLLEYIGEVYDAEVRIEEKTCSIVGNDINITKYATTLYYAKYKALITFLYLIYNKKGGFFLGCL